MNSANICYVRQAVHNHRCHCLFDDNVASSNTRRAFGVHMNGLAADAPVKYFDRDGTEWVLPFGLALDELRATLAEHGYGARRVS